MSAAILCNAIGCRHLVQFHYSGDEAPGIRLVEPHMVAYNKDEKLVLSAWFLGGASESQTGQGWRVYSLAEISQIAELEQRFSGPRHGYRPDGGKSFHNVVCGI
jgi:predicted DNA-binding transcriptional regulator YafY